MKVYCQIQSYYSADRIHMLMFTVSDEGRWSDSARETLTCESLVPRTARMKGLKKG